MVMDQRRGAEATGRATTTARDQREEVVGSQRRWLGKDAEEVKGVVVAVIRREWRERLAMSMGVSVAQQVHAPERGERVSRDSADATCRAR